MTDNNDAIATYNDAREAYEYARDVIGGRWPEGEAVIGRSPEWAYRYARDVIGSWWPEAEPTIKSDPQWAYCYTRDVIGDHWPTDEEIAERARALEYWSGQITK